MAHSMGATGWAYASGIRVTPGGSAFTLTGVFLDRITPRLLNVAATARATAAAINGINPTLRGQVQTLQMQATAVKNLGNQYKYTTLRVRAYEAELAKARIRARALYPLHGASGMSRKKRAEMKAGRVSYLLPYQKNLDEERQTLSSLKDQLLTSGARLRVEQMITTEKIKQTALAKESMRAAFGDVRLGGVAKKGLRYGALAGIGGLALAGLGLVPLAGIQMEYGAAQAQVRAIGQLSMKEMGRVSEFVLNKTKELAVTAEDAMGGLLTLVRAGIRATSEMEMLADPAMKLSVVNAIELDEAMRSLLVTQNAFNLSRESGNEIAANMQILINRSLMDFSDYVDGMKYAIAWSNKLGLTYQETSAAIATMTDAGIRAGIAGRGMRRMFSKFADDLEIITQRLERSGSGLSVFTEDGKLNLSDMLHALGDTGDTVADLEFALDTFGLRGSTAFLTLAQHADAFDEHVAAQTGDINELNSAVEVAQDSLQAQWTLLKNELKAIMLDERLVQPMKKLVKYMREQGGLQDLTKGLAELMLTFIDFWKEGGFESLVNGAKLFLGVLKGIMPIMLAIGRVLLWIAEHEAALFSALLLNRLFKAGSLINRMVTAMMTYVALNAVAAGKTLSPMAMKGMAPFVNPMYLMMGSGKGVMSGGLGRVGGAVTSGGYHLGFGRNVQNLGRAGGGIAASSVAGIIGIAAMAAIMGGMYLYGKRQDKTAATAAAFNSRYGLNTVNINGPIYGFNDFDRAVQESNQYSYEQANRYG
jgi:TP901 family phage tail tape measure protein